MLKNGFLPVFLLALFYACSHSSSTPEYGNKINETTYNFNDNWQFARGIDTAITADFFRRESQIDWQYISLPHTAHIEPLVISDQQWQGTAFYRKFFDIADADSSKHIAIKFGAAMHKADVYLNGEKLMTHKGGYLPFVVDISDKIEVTGENVLLVKLNNEDNPTIPPGKPIQTLDFNYFSGLYRNAYLQIDDKLHISDPIAANRVSAGGVRVHYSGVSDSVATVHVQTDIANFYSKQQQAAISVTLTGSEGDQVVKQTSKSFSIPADSSGLIRQQLKVRRPLLWSPAHPHLYNLTVKLTREGKIIDQKQIRIGIRSIGFDEKNRFVLNGKPIQLRGTNRHQSYPYIGYALSDNAQYRDAYKIKKGGFNFIRTAHYPPSPAFLAACDELGILFMDAIPGWQYFGNEEFQRLSLQNIREMIRRDRNHPSIVIWEASLNESAMEKAFMKRANQIVHEELPFENVYSSGWIDYAYDIFIPARQHADPSAYWNNYEKNKPLFIAEYGDWEYYAQNAGFNQQAYKDLQKEERSSRQLRGDGQKRMAQQALNFQEAHNSNLQGPAFGDANWVMYDYNRGYAPNLEASGIRDIFRLPKFSFYFFKSQAGPVTDPDARFGRPMVYIANFWSDSTFKKIKVFSNTDEVELFLNGRSLGRRQPDSGRVSGNLKHPPFSFQIDSFEPGRLRAVGYIGDKAVTEHQQITPGHASGLKLDVDISGRALEAGAKDVVFVYASIVDDKGIRIPKADHIVEFTIEGDARLIGQKQVTAEAGIATVLLQAGTTIGNITIKAAAPGLRPVKKTINVK